MPFNGAGQFNRIYNWTADAANAIPIMASRMDAEDSGFSTGLSNCICKDGQTTITADIPFSNHKITGLADATSTQDAMNQRSCDARYARLVYKAAKASDSTIASNTTLANDSELLLASLPVGTWKYRLYYICGQEASVVIGIKHAMTFAGTATYNFAFGNNYIFGSAASVVYPGGGATTSITGNYAQLTGTQGSNVIDIQGSLTVTVAGALNIQFAQNTSNASNLIIKSGSYIYFEQVA